MCNSHKPVLNKTSMTHSHKVSLESSVLVFSHWWHMKLCYILTFSSHGKQCSLRPFALQVPTQPHFSLHYKTAPFLGFSAELSSPSFFVYLSSPFLLIQQVSGCLTRSWNHVRLLPLCFYSCLLLSAVPVSLYEGLVFLLALNFVHSSDEWLLVIAHTYISNNLLTHSNVFVLPSSTSNEE